MADHRGRDHVAGHAAVIARQADAGGIDEQQLGVGAVAGVFGLDQSDGLAVTAVARRQRPAPLYTTGAMTWS